VRVMEANVAGQKFWTRAVSSFAGHPIPPVHFENWSVFLFTVLGSDSLVGGASQ
jgi:hypothetical protein